MGICFSFAGAVDSGSLQSAHQNHGHSYSDTVLRVEPKYAMEIPYCHLQTPELDSTIHQSDDVAVCRDLVLRFFGGSA